MDNKIEKIQQSQFQTQFANIGLLNDQLNYLINKVEELDNKIQVLPQPTTYNKQKDTISVGEAALELGYAIQTVYIKCSNGTLPCWRSGGRLLFSRKDLKEWILANKPKQGEPKEESVRNKMKKNRNRYSKKK